MKTTFLSGLLLLMSIHLTAQIDLQLELVSNTFSGVVDITNAGDDRLFIVEKPGRIRIIQANGTVNSTPYLDIDPIVGDGSERGLLSLAFHPDYAENGYFFVNYTNNDGNTVVARYQVSDSDAEIADPTSETVLFTIDQPFDNHNGGDLNFGPDGYLYIGTGDGGGGGDPEDNSQDPTTLLGKILRIDVDNANGSYTIPSSNPLAEDPGGSRGEIWALGLRNPWRFSFDRLTGDMWIGDVGQEEREEINFEPADSPGGLNYGWRCYEGNLSYNTTDCGPASAYTPPAYEYGHDVGCSVTGGYVYRGVDYPLLYGLYIYSDFCSGRIWSLKKQDGEWVNEELFQDSGSNFATMGEDNRGELYLGNLAGEVFRISESTCRDLFLDEGTIPPDTYQAGNKLTAVGTVETGTSVILQAAGTILLKPGFRTEAESTFQALIQGCSPAANSIATLPETEDLANLQAIPTSSLKIFPNPLRSETTIQYTLVEAVEVDIHIWDLFGRKVASPLPPQQQPAGTYTLSFSASDLPAGVYLVVIRTGERQEIGRMEVIKG